jgi:cathepsin L
MVSSMFLFVSFALCALPLEDEKGFLEWMRETNQFFTGDEYHVRFGIWLGNARLVREWRGSFQVELNWLSALTPTEYRSLLGFTPSGRAPSTAEEIPVDYAPSWDWRTKGVVQFVKNQGRCGSCWAFSAIQGSESSIAIATGKLLILSEKDLVDCVGDGCRGCKGGEMRTAYKWVKRVQKGKYALEVDYPYYPRTGACLFNQSKGVGSITDIKDIVPGNEDDLATKVQKYGPAAVGIDASQWSFQAYRGGIYDEPHCNVQNLDHGVGCIGWGAEGVKKYWIIKNSWGKHWGEKGFMRMIWKGNQCGIATDSCIPIA